MSKLITDVIQRPGGTPISFPTVDGTNGQFLKTDGEDGNLYWGSAYTFPDLGGALIAQEGKGIIGSISSHTSRLNNYNVGWSNTAPNGQYFTNYQAYTDPNLLNFINFTLGDGYPDATTNATGIGDSSRDMTRQLTFTNGNRLGYKRDMLHWSNNTSNGGHTFRIMPIRNTSNAAISISIAAYVTDYYSSGYEGTNLFVLYPNTNKYSTCTAVNSTSLGYSQTSTDMNGTPLTGTYSVPANTTVLVCLTSTTAYQTTYRFKDTNYFYNLGTTFTNSSIICDMRMLTSLYASKFNLPSTGSCIGTNVLAPLWTTTATNYGDR